MRSMRLGPATRYKAVAAASLKKTRRRVACFNAIAIASCIHRPFGVWSIKPRYF